MTTQPVASYRAATLLTFSDAEAQQLLASPEFRSEWKSLLNKCPWSTALQSPEFAGTWYECYSDVYRPLILVRYAASGEMDGLLTLAIERASGELTFSGAHQSEYNVWLALPGEQSFITGALDRLRQLGFSSLTFTYLPPAVPLEWLKAGRSYRSTIRTVQRPLLTVDKVDAVRDLLRGETRRRLKKLQENGPLSFLELRTSDELDAYYDEFIDFYDFRIGSVHGTCPFRDDPAKRAFYRALMAHDGLLHVTVTKIGEQLVAAHIGIRNKNEVMQGMVGHSPFLANRAPGKLHILHLGLALHEEGFSSFDLTPGGDAYKGDLATCYDEAHVLTIFLRKKAFALYNIAAGLRRVAKAVADILHLDRETMVRWRSAAGKAAGSPIRSLHSMFSSVVGRIWSSTEVRFYRLETKGVVQGACDCEVRRDILRDLLCYQPPDRSCRSKQEFLSDARSRIGAGVHCYSTTNSQLLVNYAWLSSRTSKSLIAEIQHTYEYPPNSAVIQDFHTHPAYRRKGFGSRALRQILSDASTIEGVDFVYVAVPAGNHAARRMVEKAGFKYQNSIIRDVRFGAAKIRTAMDSA